MAKIQIEIPDELNHWLKIQKAIHDFKTKEDTIISILDKVRQ